MLASSCLHVCVLMFACLCSYAFICVSLLFIACVLVLISMCPQIKGDKDDEEEEDDEKTATVCPYAYMLASLCLHACVLMLTYLCPHACIWCLHKKGGKNKKVVRNKKAKNPKVKDACVFMLLCVCPYQLFHVSLCLHASVLMFLVCMSLSFIWCVLVITRVCPHKKGGKDDKEEEDDKEEDKEEDEITTTVCPYAFIWCP